MMDRTCAIRLLLVGALSAPLLSSCGASGGSSGPESRDRAIRGAQVLYRKARSKGVDFSRGPCISNGQDIPGWVVDIAHSPRLPVDDLTRNQCSAYADGKADHFVELDPKGRLIRTGP